MVDLATLSVQLHEWTVDTGMTPIIEAIHAGPDGARLLVREIKERHSWDRVYFVSALGDADLTVGDDLLGDLAVGAVKSTNDIQGIALVAVTKRRGDRATPVLAAALSSRNRTIQHYSMMCLAYAGDDTAWDEAFDVWLRWLHRPSSSRDSRLPEEMVGLAYLLRWVDSHPDRIGRVVDVLDQKLSMSARAAIKPLLPRAFEAGANSKLPSATVVQDWISKSLGPQFAACEDIWR